MEVLAKEMTTRWLLPHLPVRSGGCRAAAAYLCAVPPALPADPTRIHLASTVEVNYWCQTLNCTETRLRNAVLAVGPLAADVRAYLSR